MAIPQFISSEECRWIFGLVSLGVIMNDATTNIESKTLCEHVFNSLICINSNKIAVSYSNSIFKVLRNYPTIFQSDGTIVQLYQQCFSTSSTTIFFFQS